MVSPPERRLLQALSSKRLTLLLFGALALILIPTTLPRPWPPLLPLAHGLLAGLMVNLSCCTIPRWRQLSWGVRLIHAGVLVTFAGALIGRAGFVATVNVYEGETTTTAFRWDRQADSDLGFALTVEAIHSSLYPVPLRIGVLRDGQPVKLYELKTGEGFRHQGLEALVLALEPRPASADGGGQTPALRLALTGADGRRVERLLTKETPVEQGGFTLQFVAFQTPTVERSWLDLSLTGPNSPPLTGRAAVNRPLSWRGLRLYHTATTIDPASGRPYAGIQIVQDRGLPLIYLGFLSLLLGGGLFLIDKTRARAAGRRLMACPGGGG